MEVVQLKLNNPLVLLTYSHDAIEISIINYLLFSYFNITKLSFGFKIDEDLLYSFSLFNSQLEDRKTHHGSLDKTEYGMGSSR